MNWLIEKKLVIYLVLALFLTLNGVVCLEEQ